MLLSSKIAKLSFKVSVVTFLVLKAHGLWAQEDYSGRVYVNGSESNPIQVGRSDLLQFSYENKETFERPHHFHEMHGKPLHVLAISQDLNKFYHFHPEEAHHGTRPFSVRLVSPQRDPDNFQIEKGFEASGEYFLFSEFMPMDEVMQLTRNQVTVEGPERTSLPVIADPMLNTNTIEKFFTDEDVATTSETAMFRGEVKINSFFSCNLYLPHLTLKIQNKNSETKSFEDVRDLETWLGVFGHAVLIGREGQTANEKSLQHLHAVYPIPDEGPNGTRGPFVKLAPDSHAIPVPQDLYRTWFQWKREGQVHTWEYTFQWNPPAQQPQIFNGLLPSYQRLFCL